MSKRVVPQPNVVRCETVDGVNVWSVECPGCGEMVEVDAEERHLGKDERGRDLGHHTDPVLDRYEKHYRAEH